LGFDFHLEYKKGVDNKVADAMSRREGWETVAALSSISLLVADWVENLKLQYHQDPELVKLIKQWYSNELDHQKYSLRQGLLLYKNRIPIGRAVQLQQQVLNYVHCDLAAGHSGYERTMQRAQIDFYWRGMKKNIKKFIRECLICQQNK
jgi:predicted metal-dependent hydrolase